MVHGEQLKCSLERKKFDLLVYARCLSSEQFKMFVLVIVTNMTVLKLWSFLNVLFLFYFIDPFVLIVLKFKEIS